MQNFQKKKNSTCSGISTVRKWLTLRAPFRYASAVQIFLSSRSLCELVASLDCWAGSQIANMGYYKMKHVPVSVSVSIADWMRKHGHAVPPSLTKQERAQLAECFALMDGDGSGAIDVDELYHAFRVLGLQVTKKSVSDLLAEVDADKSGAYLHLVVLAKLPRLLAC